MAVIGVRISWLMLARNSLFARLAASSSRGALGDADLQLVAGLAQASAGVLDLIEHGVESVVEHPQFVAAGVFHADRVVVFAGDPPHRLDEAEDRPRDEALQSPRQRHGHGERNGEHRQGNPEIAPALLAEFAHVHAEVNRTDLVASGGGLVHDVQAIGADKGRAARGATSGIAAAGEWPAGYAANSLPWAS